MPMWEAMPMWGAMQERGRRQRRAGLQQGSCLAREKWAGADQSATLQKDKFRQVCFKVLEKQNCNAKISSHYNEKKNKEDAIIYINLAKGSK